MSDEHWSASDRRNFLQETYSQLVSSDLPPNKKYATAIAIGYFLATHVEDNVHPDNKLVNLFSKAPKEAFDYLSGVVGEFVVEQEPEDEIDIDALLIALKAELAEGEMAQKIDEVDCVLGNPSQIEATDAEIEEVLKDLEEEVRIHHEIDQADRAATIKAHSRFFKEVYRTTCDYLTESFDKEIMEKDSLEEKSWDDTPETQKRIAELGNIIHSAGQRRLSQLLNDDLELLSLFHEWLKSKDGPGDDGPAGFFDPEEV
jgi:hypothetical protein